MTEGDAVEREYEKPQMASARRNIKQCYAYAMTGRSRSADITIRCKKDPLYGWGLTVFDSLLRNGDESMRACRADWENLYADGDVLEQAYRRVDLEEALTLL